MYFFSEKNWNLSIFEKVRIIRIFKIYSLFRYTAAGRNESIPLLQGPVLTERLHNMAYFTDTQPRSSGTRQPLVELTWQLAQTGESLCGMSEIFAIFLPISQFFNSFLCHLSGMTL